ncbi:hypothetical protein SEA_JFLIX2_88 [Rhodococcus phage Jflix2]|nr:hypothetical protein SEA_JFLIX2_88 [Rhodococcus phage Jflix2]
MGFFDWLGSLSIAQWYALIMLIELAFGLFDMFVKDRGAEFRAQREDDWVPLWADYAVALVSVVIVAVLWPVFTVLDLVRLVRRGIVWAADKYLDWYTKRTLKKMGMFEDAFVGGKVHGPTQDDDSISVMFRDPLDPHGDGTLRPGDPIFDAAMRGNGVHGVRRDDGSWELEEHEGKWSGE